MTRANSAKRAVDAVARFNPAFQEANASVARYRVLKGGAGSGKSANVATDFIRKLSDEKYRGANLLVVRKTEEANRDSTFAELCAAAERIFGPNAQKAWRATYNPLAMECLLTGNRIIFRGMNDQKQREKAKSITFRRGKLTWIWCEEATELLREDVEILDDRLRGALPGTELYYQMTFTFNPVSASHWLKREFFDTQGPDVFTHHSTYLDNTFIDAGFHGRMLRRKTRDPEGYRVYGLGQWGEAGGLILTNYSIHEFSTEFSAFDAMALGTDFGFNHAWATLLLGYKDGDVFVCAEIYERGKDTEEMAARLEGFDKRLTMWCDSAEPDRIKTLCRRGFTARAVKKNPGSVKAQIDWLKGRTLHIHPDCANMIGEIAAWRWQKDARTGAFTDEPECFCDDAIAALRYGVEGWRKAKGAKGFVRIGVRK